MTWDYFLKRIATMHRGTAKRTELTVRIKKADGNIKEMPLEFKFTEAGVPYFECSES